MSRISYRNYPILKKIKDRKLGSIPIHESDVDNIKLIQDYLSDYFKKESAWFSDNIFYVSESFEKAIHKSSDTLVKLIKTEIIESNYAFIDSGTLLFKDGSVIMYNLNIEENWNHITIHRTDRRGVFDYILVNHSTANVNRIFASNVHKFKNEEENTNYSNDLLINVMMVLLFKKYAKVEVVHSKAKSKTREFGCKYMNETDLDIQYLDSKWFTTLVNSTGFNVRGHFRLQPKKKDGEWTKELIWIDDFQKKGYNRQAGILN